MSSRSEGTLFVFNLLINKAEVDIFGDFSENMALANPFVEVELSVEKLSLIVGLVAHHGINTSYLHGFWANMAGIRTIFNLYLGNSPLIFNLDKWWNGRALRSRTFCWQRYTRLSVASMRERFGKPGGLPDLNVYAHQLPTTIIREILQVEMGFLRVKLSFVDLHPKTKLPRHNSPAITVHFLRA